MDRAAIIDRLEELEVVREGQEAYECGEYVTLEAWRREVGLDR